jgi:response regulator RpfG family c-di-GMP phosphodiesterase
MKSNHDVSWSSKGELILKDATIPKTHMVDLVNDLMRKRTTGWRLLAEALKDSNIPRELIGNQERWMYINSPIEESSTLTPKNIRGKQQSLSSWITY